MFLLAPNVTTNQQSIPVAVLVFIIQLISSILLYVPRSKNITGYHFNEVSRQPPPYTKVGDSKELVCRLTIINIREHVKLAFKRCVLDNKSGETLANRNFHEL